LELERVTDRRSVWIGFDPRETNAFAVARESLNANMAVKLPVRGVVLEDMIAAGHYTRPTEWRDGPHGARVLWDCISDAPMSTEFAITRFLTPHLAGEGWALFTDCDVMFRHNVRDLFDMADPSKAVMCVQHKHTPDEGAKMDGQMQTRYARKNWSSVMLFNCDHEANKALTLDMINTLPGRDLHRFCWLEDKHIGALPTTWNWLAGVSSNSADPAIVHYTNGIPTMRGCETAPFADEWYSYLFDWAAVA
jgi:hypothetical protein